jgi:urease accessory protein
MIQVTRIRAAVMLVLAWLAAAPAWAHHPMGGQTPATLIEGLLSGFGHPVIGPDHLAFLIAIGVLTGVSRLRAFMPLVFVAGTTAGVGMHLLGIEMAGVELTIAASVMLAGAVLMIGRAIPLIATLPLFAFAGLFHGYAYGEAIIGAEVGPIWAYLTGLAMVQGLVATGVALAVRRFGAGPMTWMPRTAGAAVASAGAVILSGLLIA